MALTSKTSTAAPFPAAQVAAIRTAPLAELGTLALAAAVATAVPLVLRRTRPLLVLLAPRILPLALARLLAGLLAGLFLARPLSLLRLFLLLLPLALALIALFVSALLALALGR